MDRDELGGVIDRIYEAAARPELWRPVLTEMTQATRAQGVVMMHHRPEGASLHAASEGLDDMLHAFFAEGWNRNNVREARARQRGMGLDEVITERDLFTLEELDREPYQLDFLDRFGLKWFASFGLRPLMEPAPFVMTINRRSASPPFDAAEVAMIATMLPHLRRAVRMSMAFGAAAQNGMMDALTAMKQPAVLLDDLGQVVRMNESAADVIGHGVSVVRGRLRAADPSADPALQRLLASVCWAGAACQAPAVDAVALPRPSSRPLIVQAAPLVNSARDLFQQARALILFNLLDRSTELDENLLRHAFGLTFAEVRLAVLLAAGMGIPSATATLNSSSNTLRSHLKSIFSKTGTRSQSELAVLLSRMAGHMEA